jgi:hypothetical protein
MKPTTALFATFGALLVASIFFHSSSSASPPAATMGGSGDGGSRLRRAYGSGYFYQCFLLILILVTYIFVSFCNSCPWHLLGFISFIKVYYELFNVMNIWLSKFKCESKEKIAITGHRAKKIFQNKQLFLVVIRYIPNVPFIVM